MHIFYANQVYDGHRCEALREVIRTPRTPHSYLAGAVGL